MFTIYSTLLHYRSFHFISLPYSSSSSSSSSSSITAMEPKLSNEEIFQKFLYAYLIENGYQSTAKLFQTETQITDPMPGGTEPPGLLFDFWNFFYEQYNSRPSLHMEQTSPHNPVIVQQPGNTSTQNQVLVQQPQNIGPVINTSTAQIIQDETPIQYHSSFESTDLSSCDISSDGKIVASGGRTIGKKPLIYYTGTTHSFRTQDAHKKAITAVRFHPEHNLLATASDDQTIKLWDATSPVKVLRYKINDALKHRGAVRSVDFHPLYDKTFCSSDDAAIKVWDLSRTQALNSFKEGGRVVRFEPVCGSLLAVANGRIITVLYYPNLNVARTLQGHVKAINSICWNVSGEMIASVSEDEVRVWSVNKGRCIHSCASKGRKFQTVIFHPRHHKSLVIGGHQCLLMLNLETMVEYTTPGATELSITGLAAATMAEAQSRFIVSASDGSVVTIWK